ncbi:hypothetical protein L9F63_007390, partial [Diploptera punctata]
EMSDSFPLSMTILHSEPLSILFSVSLLASGCSFSPLHSSQTQALILRLEVARCFARDYTSLGTFFGTIV